MTMIRRALLILSLVAVALGAGVPAHAAGPAQRGLLFNSRVQWPAIGSVVDFDFVNNRAALNRRPSSISALGSFNRTSAKYGTWADGHLSSFAIAVPAITDLGNSLERAATDVILQSNTFNTSWLLQGLNGGAAPTVSANVATSPDQTNNAWSISYPALTGTQVARMIQASSVSSGSNSFAGSIWLWTTSGTQQITLQVDDSNTGHTAGRTDITVTTTPTRYTASGSFSGETGNARLDLITGSGSGFVGLGGYTLRVFGAQLEQTAFATSYIATTSSSASRAADVFQVQAYGITRFVFTFSDGTTQTVSGIDAAAKYTFPTNLNRPVIARATGYAQ